jgi:hypothetical protein
VGFFKNFAGNVHGVYGLALAPKPVDFFFYVHVARAAEHGPAHGNKCGCAAGIA